MRRCCHSFLFLPFPKISIASETSHTPAFRPLPVLLLFLFLSLNGVSCSRYQVVSGEEGVIHLRDYGASGDGVTDNSAVFEQILNDLPNDGGRVVIPSGSYLLGDITFPEQVTIVFRNGGRFLIPENREVRINGTVETGIGQIFSGAGTVAGSLKNLQVFPQWFGARGDGENNDAPAIQQAADLAAESLGNTLLIPEGEYLFLDDIYFMSNIRSNGLLIKEIEIDEERTRFSNFTFVPTHYPVNNPSIYFLSDNEEYELEAEHFYGVQEGQFDVPVYSGIPLRDGSGTIDLKEGGTIRFHSSDFFSSRNNAKGDQYYDRNDISQMVSARGDIFPELAFSYDAPPQAAPWSENSDYQKGDYVSVQGRLFKATWPSGPSAIFEDRYLGTVDIGPVAPEAGESVTSQAITFDNGSEDALTVWRRVETRVWYREKDRPLTVDGLRVEVRLENHDGKVKRISGGVLTLRRSNMTFNNLELTVRDRDATFGRLLNSSGVVNMEFNNGYFSGATYHGLGYNILNSNVANMRYNNTVSVNSRKGLDGRHGKNVTIRGGHFNVIDDHYGRNYVIRDVVLSGQSTTIPGYVTPEADLQQWQFQTIRAFGYAGANLHVENVTINQAGGRIPTERTEMEQLYGAIGGVLSVRSDIGDLYGTVVLSNITVLSNDGDVRVFNHTIAPDFDFAGEVRVPERMIIEDIHLERPGNIHLEIGRGFDSGSYGPVEVRGTGPIGDVYSASRSLTFLNCVFQDAVFETEEESWVHIRGCTFFGNNRGLDASTIGSARDNLEARGAEVSFPVEYSNPAIFQD
ncbi:MAG: glycosyl hydrolase family 28-related protein [Balneolaceae bacterium]